MAKKLDQIIVLDLEATCWEGEPPSGQEQEIIEIGVCTLNIATGRRADKDSILVRPERSTVSPFCTKLTTLTQAQVDQGVTFLEAIETLRREYRPAERTWASYGDYDRIQLQRQCEQRGVPYPFGRTHLNIKNLVAISLNLPHEIGLERAVKLFNLPLEGTHHRGDDDAWNIAAVLAALFERTRNGERKKIGEHRMAYERMLDKTHQPGEADMLGCIGQLVSECWIALDQFLRETYQVEPELKFGGTKYGWVLSYRKGGRPLCDLYPENGAFTVLIVLGGKEAAQALAELDSFGPTVRGYLENTPAYHDGRWLWIRVQQSRDIADIQRLLLMKRKPARKPQT
jgi:inhibitor of KinA sporulation pathway (predicted exonuclease)